MAIRLQRHLGEPQSLSGGQYAAEQDPSEFPNDGMPIVTFCCPACEGLQEIDVTEHRIDRDGRVTPALRCDTQGCPFLEWVELQSWRE